MAIDSWEENFKPRRGSTDESAGQQLNRSFSVFMTAATDTAKDVIEGLAVEVGNGAPRRGFPHPDYPAAHCTRVEADPNPEHPLMWEVTAAYAEPRPEPGQDPQQPTPDKEDMKPIYSVSFRRQERYDTLDKGYTDAGPPAVTILPVPIMNAAGDLFDSPPPSITGVPIITVRRWHRSVDARGLADYFGKVNSDTIVTPVGTFTRDELLVVGLSLEPQTKRGFHGFELRTEVEFKPLPPNGERPGPTDRGFPQSGGWLPTAVLNAGWNFIDEDGRKSACRSPFGDRLGGQAFRLKADGSQAGPDDDNTYRFFFLQERAKLAPLLT